MPNVVRYFYFCIGGHNAWVLRLWLVVLNFLHRRCRLGFGRRHLYEIFSLGEANTLEQLLVEERIDGFANVIPIKIIDVPMTRWLLPTRRNQQGVVSEQGPSNRAQAYR